MSPVPTASPAPALGPVGPRWAPFAAKTRTKSRRKLQHPGRPHSALSYPAYTLSLSASWTRDLDRTRTDAPGRPSSAQSILTSKYRLIFGPIIVSRIPAPALPTLAPPRTLQSPPHT